MTDILDTADILDALITRIADLEAAIRFADEWACGLPVYDRGQAEDRNAFRKALRTTLAVRWLLEDDEPPKARIAAIRETLERVSAMGGGE